MSYLLDTPVVSELVRPVPNAGVIEWMQTQDEDGLFLSVLTLGELEKGIAKLRRSRRKAALQKKWVRTDLAVRFEGRVLAVDRIVAGIWGLLVGEPERKGRPLPVIDSLSAATATAHELVLVSRNVMDFERCGVECLNPWSQ